jgi:putative transposase
LRASMPRVARVVVPGEPHHVTQRGNRREAVFFADDDYRLYLDLLGAGCRRAGVAVWGYCLMPNHVHLILAPAREDGLARAIGEAHRRYTAFVNARARRTGHLFQSRFASAAMDEDHLMAAFLYVALNPVRARLAAKAEDWPWSSARTWLGLGDDGITDTAPALGRMPDIGGALAGAAEDVRFAALRRAELTGRPAAADGFTRALEARLKRPILARKPGRPAIVR